MARPRKNNAEYFSHDVTMRNNKKIKAVRAKFGLIGYAIWNMFLETLTESENFEAEFDELDFELLAGDYGLDLNQLKEILDYFVYVKLLKVSDTETIVSDAETKLTKKYWSEELKNRLKGVVDKRDKAREKADYGHRNYHKPDVSDTETQVSDTETTQSESETPQKKVKEKKVNKKKEYIPVDYSQFQHFENENFKKAYAEYLEMRKQNGKRPTVHAEELVLNDLKKYPVETAIKMLEKSIVNNWTGVFPLEDRKSNNRTPGEIKCRDGTRAIMKWGKWVDAENGSELRLDYYPELTK